MNSTCVGGNQTSLNSTCVEVNVKSLPSYWGPRNIFVNVLAAVIIIFNILLIYIILGSKTLRNQRFNLIMISLALTDCLCGVVIPFNTLRFKRWELGYPMCHIITSLVVILCSSSIYNFIGVNIDRLIAIKDPANYRNDHSRTNVKRGILLCWILSLLPAVPMWIPAFDTRTSVDDGSMTTCSFPYDSVEWVWWAAATAFIIPTIIILITWCLIIHHFVKNPLMGNSGKAQKYHRKISLIMGIITGAFLICWWPYAIIFMLNDNAKYKIVLGNVVVLAYSNSLINPVIYMVINKHVREAVWNLITFKGVNNVRDIDIELDSDGAGKRFFQTVRRMTSTSSAKIGKLGKSGSSDK